VDLFLFAAALAGGALNAVAGGGSFLTLPALICAGVAPVTANATSTLALWPGSAASAIAYRVHVSTSRTLLGVLLLISVCGGLVGALLLVGTSDTSFMGLLPWLMLTAAVTLSAGGQLQKRLGRAYLGRGARHPAPSTHSTRQFPLVPLLVQLAIAAYGGYFGGGAGIMMLAMLSLAGLSDIHEMNGIKSLMAVAINAVALIAFILYGVVDWRPGLVMVAGAVVGGYAGASLARRLQERHVRGLVLAVAWTMTAYFFVRQFGSSVR
jgi:uncharacterized membrane protein YfcA